MQNLFGKFVLWVSLFLSGLCSLLCKDGISGRSGIIQDLKVTEEVYWHLVNLKIKGKFRSIDEVLRNTYELPPGNRPYLKCKEDDFHEDIKPK